MTSVKKGTTWTQKFRIASPIIASTTTIATLITCVVISRVNDVYVGGLKWPYFSDMGRDAPAYHVFCAGLTIVAIFLSITWFFNYQYQRGALQRSLQLGHVSSTIKCLCVTVLVFGIISTIGLPLLSFFDTASYPALHAYSAYWFFCWETLAVFINTYISYKIYQGRKMTRETSFMGVDNLQEQNSNANSIVDHISVYKDKRLHVMKRTFLIQFSFTILFFIAFLLYIPIGLLGKDANQRLFIAECLEKQLGTTYCTETMRLNKNETKLWNYENELGWSQLRAGGQLGCILTLIGYSVSFLSHDYDLQDREGLEEQQANNSNAVAFQRPSSPAA